MFTIGKAELLFENTVTIPVNLCLPFYHNCRTFKSYTTAFCSTLKRTNLPDKVQDYLTKEELV